MGLFGFGKKKDNVKLQAVYYGGDLEGFAPNYAATLALTDTELTIESKKAKATLNRDRLLSCEVFADEKQYTAKYKGHAVGGTTAISGTVLGDSCGFIVLSFKAKDGTEKRMDFMFFALNVVSAMAMQKAVNGSSGEKKEYSL